jgi:hypothetical protein
MHNLKKVRSLGRSEPMEQFELRAGAQGTWDVTQGTWCIRKEFEQPLASIPCKYFPVTFSMGRILEDDCSVSWYKPPLFELLEIDPAGGGLTSPREIMAEYVNSYFAPRVKSVTNVNLESGERAVQGAGGVCRCGQDRLLAGQSCHIVWNEHWCVICFACHHRPRGTSICPRIFESPVHQPCNQSLSRVPKMEFLLGEIIQAGTSVLKRFYRVPTKRNETTKPQTEIYWDQSHSSTKSA